MRIFLAALMLLSPQLAFAGKPCYVKPYVAPVVVPPQVTQHNTYFTYQFSVPVGAYAQTGQTLYAAQGLDKALLLDQSRRLAESATTLVSQAISGHQSLTYEAFAQDAQAQSNVSDVALLHEIKGLVAELRAGRVASGGQQGPLALQAPQSPLQQFVAANCIQCHSGANQGGGFDFSKADELSFEILDKMDTAVEEGTMPKGKPLPPEGIAAWCKVFKGALKAGIKQSQSQPPPAPDHGQPVPQGMLKRGNAFSR